jgi:hypothetical protein
LLDSWPVSKKPVPFLDDQIKVIEQNMPYLAA